MAMSPHRQQLAPLSIPSEPSQAPLYSPIVQTPVHQGSDLAKSRAHALGARKAERAGHRGGKTPRDGHAGMRAERDISAKYRRNKDVHDNGPSSSSFSARLGALEDGNRAKIVPVSTLSPSPSLKRRRWCFFMPTAYLIFSRIAILQAARREPAHLGRMRKGFGQRKTFCGAGGLGR
jgi:hypothetical protein